MNNLIKSILGYTLLAAGGAAIGGTIVNASIRRNFTALAKAELRLYAEGAIEDAVDEYIDDRSVRTITKEMLTKINDYDPSQTATKVFDEYVRKHGEDYIRKEAHPVIREAVQGKLKNDLEDRMEAFDYVTTIRKAVREEVSDYIKNNADSIIKSEVKTYVHDRVDGLADTIKTMKNIKDICQ